MDPSPCTVSSLIFRQVAVEKVGLSLTLYILLVFLASDRPCRCDFLSLPKKKIIKLSKIKSFRLFIYF